MTPLALVLLALGVGILPRLKAHAALRTQTAVVQHARGLGGATEDGAGRAAHRVAGRRAARIRKPRSYARTNGYLAHWYKDIGTQVPAGELLADIETPEVDAQLEQARADAAIRRKCSTTLPR